MGKTKRHAARDFDDTTCEEEEATVDALEIVLSRLEEMDKKIGQLTPAITETLVPSEVQQQLEQLQRTVNDLVEFYKPPDKRTPIKKLIDGTKAAFEEGRSIYTISGAVGVLGSIIYAWLGILLLDSVIKITLVALIGGAVFAAITWLLATIARLCGWASGPIPVATAA